MPRKLAYTLLLLCACVLSSGADTKRALLIGISSYPSYKQPQLNWSNIHGANDVALLASTLRRQGFATAALTNRNATAQAIRAALARLASQTNAGDLVYFHFSGHGQPVEDQDGDEADGWDEAIVPYNAGQRYIKGVYEGANHITDNELNRYVTAIRKRERLRICSARRLPLGRRLARRRRGNVRARLQHRLFT